MFIFVVMSVSWIYGVDNFISDIKMMLPDDSKLKDSAVNWMIWKILWKFVTPGLQINLILLDVICITCITTVVTVVTTTVLLVRNTPKIQ